MGLGDGEVILCKCLSLTCVFEYKCAKPLVSELIISLQESKQESLSVILSRNTVCELDDNGVGWVCKVGCDFDQKWDTMFILTDTI